MSFTTGKLVRVVMRATAGAYQHVNTLHYDLHDDTVSGGANDPQALADFFRDNVTQHYAALFGASYVIQPIEVVEELDPLNPHDPRSSWISGVPTAGTRLPTTDVLPPSMCVVVRLESDLIGRRNNGRMFISGEPHEGDQNAGDWTSAWIATVQAFVTAIPRQPDISTGPSQSTANWSVYSRTSRSQSIPNYLAHIQSAIVRSRVHWLRSRES